MQHSNRLVNGLHMFLGANPRIRDPREDKYHFMLARPRTTADLSQPVVLSSINGYDYRVKIGNQMNTGACAAFTAQECAEIERNFTGQAETDVHPGWLYYKVRDPQHENSFPDDAGSATADNLDIAIAGVPKFSLYQYVDDASFAYPASMDADAPNQAYVGSHHPFYPTDTPTDPEGFLKNIWIALRSYMPVALSMFWTDPFFDPVNGMLPAGNAQAQEVGGHAITIWGCVPPANGTDGLILCQNHWTDGWNTAAPSLGFGARPGDFAIPWSYFKDVTTNSMIFEARAVSGVAIAPNPTPTPTPTNCKDAANAAVASVLAQIESDASAKPLNRVFHYRLQGAQAMQDAINANM